MDLEMQTDIVYTGVVGILKGKADGPVIALRADMDALPVKELANVPLGSEEVAEYNGQVVPVSHVCGHDAHTAILMGVDEVLSAVKDDLEGTVKFIFQPAEVSKPNNKPGGSESMLK